MNPSTNCPHCGSPYRRRRINWKRKPLIAPTLIFACRSELPANGFWYRSDHCKMLEARDIAEDERMSRVKAEAENQKLRELLERAFTIAGDVEERYLIFQEYDQLIKRDPAPEESANPTCSNTTHKFSHCDCKEPAPDDLHAWMGLQETINLDIAGEIAKLRAELEAIKNQQTEVLTPVGAESVGQPTNTTEEMGTGNVAHYNLYLITQKENTGYDTYDGAVVCAPDEETARNMNPSTGKPMTVVDWECAFPAWETNPKRVKVKWLGVAASSSKQGVVLASFIAG